jgi:hypothetical protein
MPAVQTLYDRYFAITSAVGVVTGWPYQARPTGKSQLRTLGELKK